MLASPSPWVPLPLPIPTGPIPHPPPAFEAEKARDNAAAERLSRAPGGRRHFEHQFNLAPTATEVAPPGEGAPPPEVPGRRHGAQLHTWGTSVDHPLHRTSRSMGPGDVHGFGPSRRPGERFAGQADLQTPHGVPLHGPTHLLPDPLAENPIPLRYAARHAHDGLRHAENTEDARRLEAARRVRWDFGMGFVQSRSEMLDVARAYPSGVPRSVARLLAEEGSSGIVGTVGTVSSLTAPFTRPGLNSGGG